MSEEKMDLLKKAEEIARKAHANQVDKAGEPYINHPQKVSSLCESFDAKIVGWLHDVVEDTDYTFEDLRKEGFNEELIEALRCVTKEDDYVLEDYYSRIKNNKIAREVKIADLTHNSDLSRIPENASEELKNKMCRKQKQYLKYKEYLLNDDCKWAELCC